MKKIFFSFSVYRDAFRQLRTIGIVGTCILTLGALVSPLLFLGETINKNNVIDYAKNVTLYDDNITIVISFIAFAPFLTLYLFHFQNKRGSSDIYHSFPIRRISLFFSFWGAIVTWIVIALLISNSIPMVIWLSLSKHCSIHVFGVLVTLLNMFASSVLVSAAIALAMSLTGTLFSNIVVSLLILFLPRLIILAFTMLLDSSLPITNGIPVISVLSSSYNVVTDFCFSVIHMRKDTPFTFAGGGIYTLVLAVIYIGFAAYLFHHRKSENAERSAGNQIAQTIYRLSCAMIVCLFPCYFIVSYYFKNPFFTNSGSLISIVLLYLLAVLVYFLFELITMHKWKKLASAIPALGILVLMNLAFIFSVISVYDHTLHTVPVPDEIRSVRLLPTPDQLYQSDNSLYYENSYDENNTLFLKQSGIKLKDPVILKMISDQLSSSIFMIRKGYPIAYDAVEASFAIELSDKTIYRNIGLSKLDEQLLYECLSKKKEFRDIYTYLPDIGENAASVKIDGLNKADSEKVYRQLQEELPDVKFEERYKMMGGSLKESKQENPSIHISISSYYGLKQTSIDFNLSKAVPKTYQLFISKVNRDENLMKIRDTLNSASKSMVKSTLYVFHSDPKDEHSIAKYDLDSLSAKEAAYINKLIDALQLVKKKPFQINKKVTRLELIPHIITGKAQITKYDYDYENPVIYYMNQI